ncbi:hypothetical protein MKW94_023696, partial [Papaver nudicaule]|nr:hypothetical protein [Papaver nudicaule]
DDAFWHAPWMVSMTSTLCSPTAHDMSYGQAGRGLTVEDRIGCIVRETLYLCL